MQALVNQEAPTWAAGLNEGPLQISSNAGCCRKFAYYVGRHFLVLHRYPRRNLSSDHIGAVTGSKTSEPAGRRPAYLKQALSIDLVEDKRPRRRTFSTATSLRPPTSRSPVSMTSPVEAISSRQASSRPPFSITTFVCQRIASERTHIAKSSYVACFSKSTEWAVVLHEQT